MFIFSKFFLLFNKLLLILFILANLSLSYAEQLKIEKIKINGAKRTSDSFILNFLPEYPNTIFNNDVLNEFTKDPDKRDYLVSNKKIEEMGWAPKYDLDFGIIELKKLYSMLNLNNFSNI